MGYAASQRQSHLQPSDGGLTKYHPLRSYFGPSRRKCLCLNSCNVPWHRSNKAQLRTNGVGNISRQKQHVLIATLVLNFDLPVRQIFHSEPPQGQLFKKQVVLMGIHERTVSMVLLYMSFCSHNIPVKRLVFVSFKDKEKSFVGRCKSTISKH